MYLFPAETFLTTCISLDAVLWMVMSVLLRLQAVAETESACTLCPCRNGKHFSPDEATFPVKLI